MKYIITESQESDIILKLVFNQEPKKQGILSKLLKLKDSDYELGRALLEKAKTNQITDVTETSFGNTHFTYRFKVNGFPFIVKYRYKKMKDPNARKYSITSPVLDQDINISEEHLSLITDYVFPKGYQLQTTMDILDEK